MIQDKRLYLNHFKIFQTFLGEMSIPDDKRNAFFQLVQNNDNLPFIMPVLEQMHFNLPHIYPTYFYRRMPFLILSYLNELADDQLFFSLGFMSAQLYERVEKEMVFSSHPDLNNDLKIHQIFERMLNKSDSEYCVIPLKKEYIDYVQDIRRASELMSLFYTPELSANSFHLGLDQPVPVFSKNKQEADYQILKTFLLVQNEFDDHFLVRHYPNLWDNTKALMNDYFHRSLDPLMNIGDNKMDPVLPKRVRVLSSFFKLLLEPDPHFTDRQKERRKFLIKRDLTDALRHNPDYFNPQCNTWNEMNAQWLQQAVPINDALLHNQRNKIRTQRLPQTLLWKIYGYLRQKEK